MRKDNRPYFIKRLNENIERWYTDYYIKPQLNYLGEKHQFVKPWHMEIFGPAIRVGKHCNIVSSKDSNIKLIIWGKDPDSGSITIGDYVFMAPGVRITAYNEVNIGNNCLIANGVYITDSDWHGLYDRVQLPADYTPVNIGNNVWLGDHATVIKGVTIGDNSVVGAASVVTRDVPANVVVAGNPAKIVKRLDPNKPMKMREQLLNMYNLEELVRLQDHSNLKHNTLLSWLWNIIKPSTTK